MKKAIFVFFTLSLLILTMTSCTMETGTGDPLVITHNPKNLLDLEKSDNTFSRREVFMWFTMPQDFGSTGYTLQFSPSNTPYNFETVMSGADPLTTTNPLASGYSVPVPSPNTEGYFRLLIHGGDYDGQHSNIVFATQCAVDIGISWSLDYSMTNTGRISPRVGFGIVAAFTVAPDDDDSILNSLTYKWYRVNPNDFEDRELIVGQTDLSYTTQLSDVDHYILVVATGSVENFYGGFCNAMTDFVVTYNL